MYSETVFGLIALLLHQLRGWLLLFRGATTGDRLVDTITVVAATALIILALGTTSTVCVRTICVGAVCVAGMRNMRSLASIGVVWPRVGMMVIDLLMSRRCVIVSTLSTSLSTSRSCSILSRHV